MTMPHPDGFSIGQAIDNAIGGYANVGNSGAAKTLDFTPGAAGPIPVQEVVLTASAPTITLKGASSGGQMRRIRVVLTQDGVGTRLLPTFSPALNYGVAGAPTLSTAAGKKDILDIAVQGTNYYCVGVIKGF